MKWNIENVFDCNQMNQISVLNNPLRGGCVIKQISQGDFFEDD